jgi:two-component system, NtrC family, sensor kinase
MDRQRGSARKPGKLREEVSAGDAQAPTPQQSRRARRQPPDTLERELAEARAHQQATSEVLQIISRSPRDAQPVLDAIVDSAARLSGSSFANMQLFDGTNLYPAASSNFSKQARSYASEHGGPPGRWHLIGRAVLDRATVHVKDVLADPEYSPEYARSGGWRAALAVPMMRDGKPIGALAIGKGEAEFYSDSQVRLISTFADQAVIAIENARLFEEVQRRNRELSEALEQQKATSEILGVISNAPRDAQPVFEAIARSALKLCDAIFANVFLCREGLLHYVTSGSEDPRHQALMNTIYPMAPDRTQVSGRVVLSGKIVKLESAQDDPEYNQRVPNVLGWRRILGVPMLRGGETIGVLVVGWAKSEPIPDSLVHLLQSFAGQAVIAIENARLFNEVEARNRDLQDALQRQTATAEVLKVISRSAFELQPVLNVLVKSAVDLCDAYDAVIFLREGDLLHTGAHHGPIPVDFPAFAVKRTWVTGRAVVERKPVHVEDLLQAKDEFPDGQDMARRMGHRTILGMPLLRGEDAIGALVIRRREVRPFTARQIELLATFADQAVIAIENVRLFDEVQARTADLEEALDFQKGTAEVLEVIGRSASSLQPVLDAIIETTATLCHADMAVMRLVRDGELHFAAGSSRNDPALTSHTQRYPIALGDQSSIAGRVARSGATVHVHDVTADPDYHYLSGVPQSNVRTALGVPLVQAGVVVGVLALLKSKVEPFSARQIELVETFADQAVIALSNVQLFEKLETRTVELARSLEDLKSAQDRLIQTEKLASLGQLTAGIAHELKNPLNFVNNFSSISAELVEEMSGLLGGLAMDEASRAEFDELASLLRENLAKVIRHGKRADSIIRNMLLHSREGSGEHAPVDINSVVEESLNLAYHGARAETPGFNITLERELDPEAGAVDLYLQEITRVLLNIISNGFYATAKRKSAQGDGYEPVLRAGTRNLGDAVEIVIRDNGTGIPEEVRQQIFNPFFTTKPAGEGTG